MTDPETAREWQDAVDAASVFLAIFSAKLYGLVETNIPINVARCEELLERGKLAGFVPSRDAIQKAFVFRTEIA